MITGVFLNLFKKDPSLKRNLLKTSSWLVLSAIGATAVVWLIGRSLSLAIAIGGATIISSLLYYFHEKLWQGPFIKKGNQGAVNKPVASNLFKQTGKISRTDREMINGNKAFTLWLTGLSGAGKSTLANEVESWIHHQKGQVYILDGDNTRLGINSDLTFSDEDRAENIRRVAEMCKLFNDAGIIVIASFISPFKRDRALAGRLIGEADFIEVFIDASINVCQKRDTKGLYKLALAGKIKNFTGIDSPYEKPDRPAIHLHTDSATIYECLETVKGYLIYNQRIALDGQTEQRGA